MAIQPQILVPAFSIRSLNWQVYLPFNLPDPRLKGCIIQASSYLMHCYRHTRVVFSLLLEPFFGMDARLWITLSVVEEVSYVDRVR
jgi:hypothetical protein